LHSEKKNKIPYILKKRIIPPESPRIVPGFALNPIDSTYTSRSRNGCSMVSENPENVGKR
jgi:hypothetical protein